MSVSANKQIVTTDKAPKAIGPYSVAVRTSGLVFASGQIGLDPATGELVVGGLTAQVRQVLTNLKHVLEAADSGLEHVVKTTVCLKDMNDFPGVNAAYGEFFVQDPPARSTIAVAELPKGALVEIEAVALSRPT
jgi:2-iminobutanoate/2-iminopropanoate deaminase